MDDQQKKTYRIVDHANKRADSAGFDPYQFWLDQVRRISQQRGAGSKEGEKNEAGGNEVSDDDEATDRPGKG